MIGLIIVKIIINLIIIIIKLLMTKIIKIKIIILVKIKKNLMEIKTLGIIRKIMIIWII